jgi:sugar O-acyltransferase (sialic acid O-acetyltransferase NeuD family)
MTKPLIAVGASGHLKDVSFILEDQGEKWSLAGILDDDPALEGTVLASALVLGPTSRWVDYANHWFVIAIGNPRARARVVRSMAGTSPPRFATLAHARSSLSRNANLGPGCMIGPFASVSAGVSIGSHSIVNAGATIAHEASIGNFVTIAPQAAISGNVTLEDGVEVGTGALIRQGVRVGRGAMVGMGAVVLSDVPANTCVVGNPARALRQLPPFGEAHD